MFYILVFFGEGVLSLFAELISAISENSPEISSFKSTRPSTRFSKTPDDFSSPGSKEATIFGVVHRFLHAQTVWVVVFGDADASCPRARNPASQSTTRLSRRARPVDSGAGSWCDVTTLVEPWEIV